MVVLSHGIRGLGGAKMRKTSRAYPMPEYYIRQPKVMKNAVIRPVSDEIVGLTAVSEPVCRPGSSANFQFASPRRQAIVLAHERKVHAATHRLRNRASALVADSNRRKQKRITKKVFRQSPARHAERSEASLLRW